MIDNDQSTLPIIIVDDEPGILASAKEVLQSAGLDNVQTLQDSRELMPLLARQEAAVIILDLYMPHRPGMELLQEATRLFPGTPTLIMTAAQDVDTAVACMKQGAFDYLVKPVEESRIVTSVQRALEMRDLRREVGSLKRYLLTDQLDHTDVFARIITNNRRMRAIFQYVEAISVSNEPILVTGESGVGKELISEAIHQLSGRPGRMVRVNVAGLDDTMFSDTLFGHRRGAFTGAHGKRKGMITKAEGGTLFLDEIGDLNATSQVKLLRLLQDRHYFPLGSDVPRVSDARIVLATNHDLEKRIRGNLFRLDLFYRISSHQIHIPPLREREGDIPLLTRYFLEEAAQTMGKTTPTPPPELFQLLAVHPFPGNIRELRALIYDAVARHQGGLLSLESFRSTIRSGIGNQPATAGAVLPVESLETLPTLEESENQLIREAMKRADGNQGIAAALLGISRSAMNRRLRKLDADPS